MCEPEGEGIGRCVTVMVGGRSGGHRGAALCSVGAQVVARVGTSVLTSDHIGIPSIAAAYCDWRCESSSLWRRLQAMK